MTHPFQSTAVENAFTAFPSPQRAHLMSLRDLIFNVAAKTEHVGAIKETLKWGQPSFVAKTGTPIRVGLSKIGEYAIYTHCQTSVISDFQKMFPHDFRYDGNRAILFGPAEPFPAATLSIFIHSALTYHKNSFSD